MHLTWANLWSFALGANALAWACVPEARATFTLILLMQGAILVWGVVDIRSQFFGEVHFRNAQRPDLVALTFDDGPDPAITPDILLLLDKYKIKATFFVVARRAEKHPELVLRAMSAGHTIACHDLSHTPTGNFRRGRQMRLEVGKAQQILASIIGRPPAIYRPPVGLMNPHVLPTLRLLGMACVGWSRSAGEAGNRLAVRIEDIPTLGDPGEIVLLHDVLPVADLKGALLRNLDELFESIQSRGLKAVTVDQLLGIPAYVDRSTVA